MTDHLRICFIYNPSANGGKAARQEPKIKSAISKYWPGAEFLETEPGNRFWDDIESKSSDFDILVACGGDGTVHNTGNIAANRDCALGVIPLGSGNDFAKMNKIPESADAALNLLLNGREKGVDLIRCTGDLECWCLNTLGLGLDGLANRYTRNLKAKIGKAGYISGAVKAVFKSKPFEARLTIDGRDEKLVRLLMLTCCIGFREGGQFIVAPGAVNDDGKMNLLSIEPMSKLSLLIALPRFLIRFPSNLEKVSTSACGKLEIFTDNPIAIHVDGEYEKVSVQNIVLEVYKRKLRLVTLK